MEEIFQLKKIEALLEQVVNLLAQISLQLKSNATAVEIDKKVNALKEEVEGFKP